MGTSEKLYHANLSSQVEGMTRGLNDRLDKLESAKNAFNALVNSQTLKGEAADAMTAYIDRVHLSLINLQESAIKTFIRDLAQYDQRYLSVDSDGSFQLVRQEMEDLEKQIPIKQKQVEESKATFQSIMASVADIINPPEGTSLLTHLDNIDRDLPVMEKLIKDQLQGWSDYEDPKYFQETISYLQAAQQMLAENQGVVVPNRPGVLILKGLPLKVPALFSKTSGAWQVLNKVRSDKEVKSTKQGIDTNKLIDGGQRIVDGADAGRSLGGAALASKNAISAHGTLNIPEEVNLHDSTFGAITFGYGMFSDMTVDHATFGEAVIHNVAGAGVSAIAGADGTLVASSLVAGTETAEFGGALLLGLTPVGWGIIVGLAVGTVFSILYNNNVGGLHTLLDNIGKAVDKQLKSVDDYDKSHPSDPYSGINNGEQGQYNPYTDK